MIATFLLGSVSLTFWNTGGHTNYSPPGQAESLNPAASINCMWHHTSNIPVRAVRHVTLAVQALSEDVMYQTQGGLAGGGPVGAKAYAMFSVLPTKLMSWAENGMVKLGNITGGDMWTIELSEDGKKKAGSDSLL